MQTFNVGEPPVLDVENHGFGLVPEYFVPQFFARAGYIH